MELFLVTFVPVLLMVMYAIIVPFCVSAVGALAISQDSGIGAGIRQSCAVTLGVLIAILVCRPSANGYMVAFFSVAEGVLYWAFLQAHLLGRQEQGMEEECTETVEHNQKMINRKD